MLATIRLRFGSLERPCRDAEFLHRTIDTMRRKLAGDLLCADVRADIT